MFLNNIVAEISVQIYSFYHVMMLLMPSVLVNNIRDVYECRCRTCTSPGHNPIKLIDSEYPTNSIIINTKSSFNAFSWNNNWCLNVACQKQKSHLLHLLHVYFNTSLMTTPSYVGWLEGIWLKIKEFFSMIERVGEILLM